MSESRLYHSISSAILELIESGEFPPGSRLPGERDLAERFKVSRVTIREAEIALEAKGRIAIRTGSGAYVLAPPERAPDALPDVSAFDLTAARAVIEAEAAALASGRITDAELRELESWVAAMAGPEVSDEAAGEADRQFHLSIARIAGNPVVEYCVGLIWRMRNELPRVREVYMRVCTHDWQSRTEEHAEILGLAQARSNGGTKRNAQPFPASVRIDAQRNRARCVDGDSPRDRTESRALPRHDAYLNRARNRPAQMRPP